jgi:hypothetical protein
MSSVTEISYYPSMAVMCKNGLLRVLDRKIIARKGIVKFSLLKVNCLW